MINYSGFAFKFIIGLLNAMSFDMVERLSIEHRTKKKNENTYARGDSFGSCFFQEEKMFGRKKFRQKEISSNCKLFYLKVLSIWRIFDP